MHNIIEITEDRLEELVQLEMEMWPDCVYDEEVEHICYLLKADHEQAFLYLDADQKAIGFILLSLRRDYVEGAENSPVGYVEGIYVREAHRRKGIAAALIKKGEQWTKEKGCTEMGSDADLSNLVSHQFHQQMGFKEVNRVVCFHKKLD